MQLNYTVSVPELKTPETLMLKVEAAILRTAQQVVDDARSFAPARTGTLRNSIEVASTEVTTDSVTVTIVAGAPYAGFVEFGHMTRMGPHRRFVSAQPFMGPALQLAEANVVRNLTGV
jgi:HK97 gp10 family phage protein